MSQILLKKAKILWLSHAWEFSLYISQKIKILPLLHPKLFQENSSFKAPKHKKGTKALKTQIFNKLNNNFIGSYLFNFVEEKNESEKEKRQKMESKKSFEIEIFIFQRKVKSRNLINIWIFFLSPSVKVLVNLLLISFFFCDSFSLWNL